MKSIEKPSMNIIENGAQSYNKGYSDFLRHTALSKKSKRERLKIRDEADRIRKYGLLGRPI